jgi:hypothetical protein
MKKALLLLTLLASLGLQVFNRRLSAVLIIVLRNLGYTSRFLNKQATSTRYFLKNIYLVCKCPAFELGC